MTDKCWGGKLRRGGGGEWNKYHKYHNKTRQILKTMTFRMFLSVDVKLYEVRTIILDGATSNF